MWEAGAGVAREAIIQCAATRRALRSWSPVDSHTLVSFSEERWGCYQFSHPTPANKRGRNGTIERGSVVCFAGQRSAHWCRRSGWLWLVGGPDVGWLRLGHELVNPRTNHKICDISLRSSPTAPRHHHPSESHTLGRGSSVGQ